VRHLTTTDDLLRGVHVLETEPSDLPTDVSSWDPGFARVHNRWYLGFVESPSQDPLDFHLALASTGSGSPWRAWPRWAPPTTCTSVRARSWPASATGGGFSRATDTPGSSRCSTWTWSGPAGSTRRTSRTSHTRSLLQRPGGGWLMVSFDGTPYAERTVGYGGHGDLVVMAGD
jgi:hypothetical protein